MQPVIAPAEAAGNGPTVKPTPVQRPIVGQGHSGFHNRSDSRNELLDGFDLYTDQ